MAETKLVKRPVGNIEGDLFFLQQETRNDTLQAGYFVGLPGWCIGPHFHEFCVDQFKIRWGRLAIRFVDPTWIILQAGDEICIPINTVHQVSTMPDSDDYVRKYRLFYGSKIDRTFITSEEDRTRITPEEAKYALFWHGNRHRRRQEDSNEVWWMRKNYSSISLLT
jgi:quercetin dioxygenase-like cupin family protein